MCVPRSDVPPVKTCVWNRLKKSAGVSKVAVNWAPGTTGPGPLGGAVAGVVVAGTVPGRTVVVGAAVVVGTVVGRTVVVVAALVGGAVTGVRGGRGHRRPGVSWKTHGLASTGDWSTTVGTSTAPMRAAGSSTAVPTDRSTLRRVMFPRSWTGRRRAGRV